MPPPDLLVECEMRNSTSTRRKRRRIMQRDVQKEILKDKDYDLISVLYHASQAAETCSQYANDAEREGDKEAVKFFHEVIQENNRLIQKGKDLLQKRLQ
jgi:hypothetical protein